MIGRTTLATAPRLALYALLAAAAASNAMAQSETCANAPLITPGNHSGTTVGATNDGSADCGSSFTAPDVWYKIVAPTNRELVVQTCGGAGWDTVLSIHTACPGTPANQIACNDDNCGLQSVTSASVAAGSTSYIRVSGYAGSTGPFTLNVSFQDPPPPPTNGPDVTIHELIDIAYYATSGGINAYAIGTDACNVGDAPVAWYSNNNRHPVIAQNMYRLKAGRFEQIGQSWLKHGFASTNSPGCGSCIQPPDGGAQLGISCTDAYGSGLNGQQSNLGPRSEVNATSGVYLYPFGGAAFSGQIARRLQVAQVDVTPASNPGATYYAECQYVTQDDAGWNNGLNNNTWRQIAVGATGTPGFIDASHRQQAAIMAWQLADPTVVISNADYLDGAINARFIVGSKVTDNQNGTWTYEYAIQNINSHRSGGSFSVPLNQGVVATLPGFHDVFYHSGEPFSGTDWPSNVSANDVNWTTQTFAQNPNANALRWGTLYNFRFTANSAPRTGNASIGLFRTGTPAAVSVAVPIPSRICDADFNCDGNADQDDVGCIINVVAGNPGCECQDPDFNQDGNVDQDDVIAVITLVAGGGCD